MRETETKQLLKLRELKIEERKGKSNRIYIVIWLVIAILLTSIGVYGFAVGNMDLGLICFPFGLVIGIGGLEVFGVIALVKHVKKNKQQKNANAYETSLNVATAKEINEPEEDESYEFCPRCQANLTLQKGYSNDLPYWICKGCGEMLINPEIDSNISWICDGCGTMLNIQPGFDEGCGEWTCTACGFKNKIDKSEIYQSEDEYQAAMRDPYKGLADGQILALSTYREVERVNDRDDITLIEERDTGILFIKKLLTTYNRSVYDYLKTNPIDHMPQIIRLYESDNCLIVIEEYIKGQTVAELIKNKAISKNRAISITKSICHILNELHSLQKPIIHRDIKPSNIIVTLSDEVYLLDMNVAKWYDPDKTDDTKHMGTENFAAPEQVGYGLSASSTKSDIYAVGMLLNVMLTGTFPKEAKAEGDLWPIIERCISLNAEDRYTAKELIDELDAIVG